MRLIDLTRRYRRLINDVVEMVKFAVQYRTRLHPIPISLPAPPIPLPPPSISVEEHQQVKLSLNVSTPVKPPC